MSRPHDVETDYADENDSQGTANSGDELIDKLLDNYKIEFQPEIRIKFKKQLGNINISAACCKPWEAPFRLQYTVKPDKSAHPLGRYINKLLVRPSSRALGVPGGAYLFSAKIPLWLLRLQFVAGYNWTRGRPTLDYRITTKWSEGPRFKRKEVFNFGERGLLRCKWNMELSLPDMEGHLGRDDPGAQALDWDAGSMFFEVTQLDLVTHL